MEDDWKEHWNAYLREKYGSEIPEGPLKINLGEIKFYIPPLLGIDATSMNDKIGYEVTSTRCAGNLL
jgi:hypothetical protein